MGGENKMNKKRTLFLTVLLCGLTVFSTISVASEERLDTAAIRKSILGRTVSIVTPIRKIHDLRMERTGTVRHAAGDQKVAGSWSTSKGMLCLDISEAVERSCMAVIRHGSDDKHLFLFTPAGEPFGEVDLVPGH